MCMYGELLVVVVLDVQYIIWRVSFILQSVNAQPCEVGLCVTYRIGDTVKASLVGTIPLSGGNAVQELEIFSHLPTLLERKEKNQVTLACAI